MPPSDINRTKPLIRAAKARYYADARFQERVMSPPDLRKQPVKISTPAPDDWTSRVVAAATSNVSAPETSDDDLANAGIRREPELPEHEEIIPPPPPPSQEFDFFDDEPDVDAAKARVMRQRMRMTFTPPLPDSAKQSARIKGNECFEGFMQSLGRRLCTGDRFLKELSRDMAADESSKRSNSN